MKRIAIAVLLAVLLMLATPIAVSAAGVTVTSRTGDGEWINNTWQVQIYPSESKSTTLNLYNSSSSSLGVEVTIFPESLDNGNLAFELDKSSFTMPGGSSTDVTLTVKANGSATPGPAMIRTVNDVIRMALRDLRSSQNLLRLAQGTGTLDDLDSLTKWADEITDRVGKTQQVIAQPKPSITPVETASEPQEAVLVPVPVVKQETKAKKKRSTTPKKKANPEDIAFAHAVAEEMGDNKVKDWAQQFADGKISEKQWISRLTNHASASRESLDDVFARATDRMAKEGHGK